MKIHCTRGCICDCLTVDGENFSDISKEKKLKVIDKMEKKILKDGFSEYYVFEGMLSEIDSVVENFLSIYRITEDYDTCEFFINGEKMENEWKSEWETIVKDYMDHMRTSESNEVDYFIWWFMESYIGLKYQYHCDCCGDSVYSKTINI